MSTDEQQVVSKQWDLRNTQGTTINVKVKARGHSVITSGEVAPFEDMSVRLHDGTLQTAPQQLVLREIFRQIAYSFPGVDTANLPDGTEVHLHLRAVLVVPMPVHPVPTEVATVEPAPAEE